MKAPKVVIGAKAQVKTRVNDDTFFRKAEVLSIRVVNGKKEYYVHYIDFNKRLDEWTTLDNFDMKTLELPKEKNNTPKRSRWNKLLGQLEDTPSTPALLISEAQSAKEEEIEHLRHGGSMKQHGEHVSRVRNINKIEMGRYQVDTWYFSPYPEPFSSCPILYICEYCLSFYGERFTLKRHLLKCNLRHPPGNEIYRRDNLSFFELDGHKQKMYCRNLGLLSKLFLDHKTLYYDVDPFLFYILVEFDEHGGHVVGYFSKEKESVEGYNLACILTLPQHQRKGFGKLLIEFSYELTRREGKVGSPEKPLSDLGLLSYRSYWANCIIRVLKDFDGEISIQEISKLTCITGNDVLHTIQALDLLKYYKGDHIILLSKKALDNFEKRKPSMLDPNALQWTPPSFTHNQLKYI